ncbi:MAG: hypothetical protein QME89_07165 [Actinomycetota bacterium]|nr:hypothetical protein [Actinomycetota bacterium]
MVIMAVLASLLTAVSAMASGALPEEPAAAEERPEKGVTIPKDLEEVLQRIDALFVRCLEVLNGVLDKVAEEARHAIERAIGLVTKAREFMASLKVPAKWAIEPGRPGFAYPGRGAPQSPEEGVPGGRCPEEGSLLMPIPDKVPENITVPDWVPEGMVHDQRDLPGLPARPGRE